MTIVFQSTLESNMDREEQKIRIQQAIVYVTQGYLTINAAAQKAGVSFDAVKR